MQIICGQCGQQFNFDSPPGEAVECNHCGHVIFLETRSGQPEFDEEAGSHQSKAKTGFAVLAQKMLSRRMLIFCSSCGEQMKIAKWMAGRVIRCHFCTTTMRVPRIDEEELAETWGSQMGRKSIYPRLAFLLILLILAIGTAIVTFSERGREFLRKNYSSLLRQDASSPLANANQNGLANTTAKYIGANWYPFASEDFFPARPGKLYCELTVEIQAGAQTFVFSNTGKAVMLKYAKKTIVSLGEPVSLNDTLLPRQAQSRTIMIKPHTSEMVSFLFELPVEAQNVLLEIPPLPSQSITLPSPPYSMQPLGGQYVELPPRNCRPLLRNKVSSAIQAAPNHTLDVRHKDGVLTVAIPAAKVKGFGKYIDEDLYELTLKNNLGSLTCKLRQLEDDRIILYLSDKPMHQITYQRWKPETKSGETIGLGAEEY